MKTHDFDFDLPTELIAQHPLEDRSASRLLVLNRNNESIEHHHFHEIIDYLHAGDVWFSMTHVFCQHVFLALSLRPMHISNA